MKKIIYYLAIFLFCSCNTGKYYANYRAGGKSEKSDHLNTTEPADLEYKNVNTSLQILTEIKNVDSSIISHKRITTKIINSNQSISVETKSNNTIPLKSKNDPQEQEKDNDFTNDFIMDEALAQAYASPILNILAALFGLLSLSSPNAIWIAAPLYFAAGVAILVGIICFLVALVRYLNGDIDERNKKYLWLWLISFIISLALAIFVLLLFL